MHTHQVHALVKALAHRVGHAVEASELESTFAQTRAYAPAELPQFVSDVVQAAQRGRLSVMVNHLPPAAFAQLLTEEQHPLAFFEQTPDGPVPVVVHYDERGNRRATRLDAQTEVNVSDALALSAVTLTNQPDARLNGQVLFLTAFPMQTLVSDPATLEAKGEKPLTPLKRLFRLLHTERKDIYYIYVYAIVVGLINLSLPLGTQAIIGLIAGGLVFSSVILLISLVIGGVVVSGILQITQVTLVEILQRRVFTKAAFEFAYRLPRINAEALVNYYPPEIVNRFFDVMTIQKALPKVLIEITAALLQILFGLVLLSFYNPLFIVFGLLMLLFVVGVVYAFSPKALETSLKESKYKYKLASWLEEVARTLTSFKQAGSANLPMQKTDHYVNEYLEHRAKHFDTLRKFFTSAVVFKTLVTSGLLILGTILVVDRQLSLGQFVASEIVIVLIVGSVEKIILSIDVVFDLLTGVEKLGNVTDFPLEKSGDLRQQRTNERGLALRVRDLHYQYPGAKQATLRGVSFEVAAGEHVALTGESGAGRDTLARVIAGMLPSYEGIIAVNGVSIRDLSLASLRDAINRNVSPDEFFEGTILDNITVGRTNIAFNDVVWALDQLELTDALNALPQGLHTPVVAAGDHFSRSTLAKLLLARCVVARPQLIILDDYLQYLDRPERLKVIGFLTNKAHGWSLLSLSNDPLLLGASDKVLVLAQGRITMQGTYQSLLKEAAFQEVIA